MALADCAATAMLIANAHAASARALAAFTSADASAAVASAAAIAATALASAALADAATAARCARPADFRDFHTALNSAALAAAGRSPRIGPVLQPRLAIETERSPFPRLPGSVRGMRATIILRLSEVLLANAGEHGHWRLLEGPSTRPRLIYSSGLVGSFGERDGGADVAEVT